MEANNELAAIRIKIEEKETCLSKRQEDIHILEQQITTDQEEHKKYKNELDILEDHDKVNSFFKRQLTNALSNCK